MKIYLIAAMAAFILFAFSAGTRIGTLRCERNTARTTTTQQTQIIQHQVKINEKTMHTGMRDIRRVLRKKYTIAE